MADACASVCARTRAVRTRTARSRAAPHLAGPHVRDVHLLQVPPRALTRVVVANNQLDQRAEVAAGADLQGGEVEARSSWTVCCPVLVYSWQAPGVPRACLSRNAPSHSHTQTPSNSPACQRPKGFADAFLRDNHTHARTHVHTHTHTHTSNSSAWPRSNGFADAFLRNVLLVLPITPRMSTYTLASVPAARKSDVCVTTCVCMCACWHRCPLRGGQICVCDDLRDSVCLCVCVRGCANVHIGIGAHGTQVCDNLCVGWGEEQSFNTPPPMK